MKYILLKIVFFLIRVTFKLPVAAKSLGHPPAAQDAEEKLIQAMGKLEKMVEV